MDHQEALRRSAVEKYLLQEMPDPERDEFEEHIFNCLECAADVRATAAFLDDAKREARHAAAPAPGPAPRPTPPAGSRSAGSSRPTEAARGANARGANEKPWYEFLLRPAFAGPAFACLLLIVIY